MKLRTLLIIGAVLACGVGGALVVTNVLGMWQLPRFGCDDAPAQAVEAITDDTGHIYALSGGGLIGLVPTHFSAVDIDEEDQQFGYTKLIGVQMVARFAGEVDEKTGDWILDLGPGGGEEFGMDLNGFYMPWVFLSNDDGSKVVSVEIDGYAEDPEGTMADLEATFPDLAPPDDAGLVAYVDALSADTDEDPYWDAWRCADPERGTWDPPEDFAGFTVPDDAPIVDRRRQG